MAKETTKKTLQCKIALSTRAFRSGEPANISLFQAIQMINERFTEPANRRATYGEKAVECRSYREQDGVIGIYLVGYIPGDAIGIIPHNGEELGLLPPPDNTDYLDGELMALVAEDATIICRLGLYESALAAYVEALGPPAGLNGEDASFFFKNRTDVDKLRMIADEGVAQIRFDGVASEAAAQFVAEDQEQTVAKRLVDGVWREFKALAHMEDQPDVASENLKVEVFLKFDKRTGTQIDQRAVTHIAEMAADDDEGFLIETISGRKIRPNDVLLNTTRIFNRFGKSVAFNEVFAAMLDYYRALREPEGVEHE